MYITTCVVLGLAVWHSNVYKAAAQLDETSDRTFACYGTSNSLLSPSCPSGSLVAPYQVSAGAKTNTTGCPREIVNPAQAAVCCVFDSDDCHGEYLNVDSQSTSYIYHADCVGRENCVGFARQASNMDINYLSCSPSFTYPDQTNYMFMDFYCIPGTRVGAISSANIQSSTDMIYLRGQDYTTSGIAVTSASCSVESDDCDVIISVYALDLRLANDSTGACIQDLSLSDTVFDCSDDNNFKINEIYQSSNNYMTVNLSSTVTNDGYFWIGFNTSSSGSDILTLRCPAQSQQTVCTTTTTEPTTVTTYITTEMSTDNSTDNTTEETTTEMTNTTMQNPLPTQASKHDDTVIIIGSALAAFFIVAVIIAVVVVYLYCKKCKSKPTDEENSQSQKKVPPSSDEVCPRQNDTGYIISHNSYHIPSHTTPAIPNGKPPKDTGYEAHRTGQTSRQDRRLTAISEEIKQLDKQQSETQNQKKSKERKKKKKKKDRKKREINPKDEAQSETPDELQATYYKSNAISPDEPQPKQSNEPEATLPDEQQAVFQDKSHLKLTDEPKTTYTDEPQTKSTDELQVLPPHEPQEKHPNESQSKFSDELLFKKPKNEANATPHDESEVMPSQEPHSIDRQEPQVIHYSEYKDNRTGKSFVTASGEPQDIVPSCSSVGDDSGDRRKKKRKKRRTETNNENDNEDVTHDDQENRKRKKKKKRKQKVDLDMIGESLNEHEQNAHVKRNQVSPTEGPPTVHQESH